MNNKDLFIKWLGHSCFVVGYDNIKVMFDPYRPKSVPGLNDEINIGVNHVFISHNHDDHNFDRVPCFLNLVPLDYQTIEVAHDEENGQLRGMNLIHIVYLNGYKVVHMGDIGCDLNDEQVEKLKDADLLLIPINGFYTIGSEKAYHIAKLINAKLMIPMHYYYDGMGYPDDHQLDKLLNLASNVIKTSKTEFNLKDYINNNENKVLVLDYHH